MSNVKTAQPEGLSTKAPSLKRSLGTMAIIFMVVAAATPLTTANGTLPVVFLFSENPASPVYFIIASIILVFFGAGYSAMSKHLSKAGAFYAYIQAGLGRIVGNASAVLAVGAYALTVIALTVYSGPFAQQLVTTFTPWDNSPWWLWAIVIWVVLAVLSYRNIDLSARVLGVALVLEVIVLAILGIAILAQGGANGFTFAPLNPVDAFSMGSPASGLLWATLVFVGFEATAVYRKEAKNPTTAIPRATFGAVITLGVIYVFTSFVVVNGMGVDQVVERIGADPANVIFGLSTQYIGEGFTSFVNILLLVSVFACALSFQNVVSRYLLTLGKSGLFPAYVGRVHGTHRVPSNASLVISVAVLIAIVISAVLGLDPVVDVFIPLIGILAFAVITLMVLCSIAVVVFFARNRQLKVNLWSALIAPVIAALSLGYILIMAFGDVQTVAGSPIAAVLVIALMIGLPVIGALLSMRPSRANEDDDSEDDFDGPHAEYQSEIAG